MSLIEQIEKNKRILRAEYEKGYSNGYREAEKRTIAEFQTILGNLHDHTFDLQVEIEKELEQWQQRKDNLD